MSPTQGKRNGARLQPVARHGILTQPNPLLQVLAILGVVVGVVVLSGMLVGAAMVWNAARAVDETSVVLPGQEDGQLPPALGELKGGINLLLVGTDSCEGQDPALSWACRVGDTEGERNDVTMLVNISDNPRRVTVVSFPRDMVVDIPSCDDGEGGETYPSTEKLNVSYYYGGLPCTARTITQLTGLDIQYAAAIRWTGVINMSDAVGGVTVCVAGDVHDDHTGLTLTQGEHTLQGVEALQFLRMRHGIGDQSDLARIGNQQQFMGSLVRKLQSDGVLGNPPVLLSFANTAIAQVTGGQLLLSSSLANPNRMVQIALALRSVPYEDFVFVQYPTVYAEDGSGVLPLYDDAADLFTALAENRKLELTGDTSGGYSTEVTGEVGTSGAGESPEATDAGADPAAPTTDPSADPSTPPADDVAQLPASITGQTAAQITCTVPEG